METKGRRVVVGVAIALYVAALFLPVFSPYRQGFSDNVYDGWDAFEVGLRGLLSFALVERDWWILSGAWLVNPLVWTAGWAILTERRRLAICTSWVAVVLCLVVLIRFGNILAGYPGYWCWLASAVVLAVGSSVRWRGCCGARFHRAR